MKTFRLTAAVITSAAIMFTSSPANAEYVTSRGSRFPAENMEQIAHCGLFGRDNLLFRGKSDEPWHAQTTDTGYLAVVENDRFYVHGYFWDSVYADALADRLTDTFGTGSTCEVVCDGTSDFSDDGTVVEPMVYYTLAVTDSDITYSEVLAAKKLCEETDSPDNMDCGELDWYYAPERCRVMKVPLWINRFSGTLANGLTAADVEESFGKTDLIWSIDTSPEVSDVISGTVHSGWLDAPPELMYETLAQVRAETGLDFSGDFEPEDTGMVLFRNIGADYFRQKGYTYNELAAMTDDEVRALYPGFFAGEYGGMHYDPSPFGDDTMSEYDKFRQFYGNFEWGGADLVEMKSLTHIRTYVITYRGDSWHDLMDGLSAEDFGFPAEWRYSAYRGYFFLGTDYMTAEKCWIYNYANEYRIFVPAEVAEDFESFIRLMLASGKCPDGNVEWIDGAEEFFNTVDYEPLPEYPLGDVNFDGYADMSDVVAIMRSYADPEEYGLRSVWSRRLADADGIAGVTNSDALWLQRAEAGILGREELVPLPYVLD